MKEVYYHPKAGTLNGIVHRLWTQQQDLVEVPYLDEHVEVGEGSGCESETDEQHQDSDEDLATASLAHHRDGGDQAAAMESKLVAKSADGEFEAKTS